MEKEITTTTNPGIIICPGCGEELNTEKITQHLIELHNALQFFAKLLIAKDIEKIKKQQK